ncbi:putative gustatory receptor 28b isoform X2 [Stomoxys calcitrans]|uniref:putative gustatory receptor 28b isoform X2 n=1 Tax=Stomoxys calcitrans TaxID=35570 RepID=UPI0027E2EBD5|nr:putative gustatory receptor 28b isoform X2 [Stomoxys calcitrans]
MAVLTDFLHPQDSYAAEKIMLLITFFLGLTPLRIAGPYGNRRIFISRLGLMITLVQGVFFAYCFLHSFCSEESIVGFFFKTEISKVGDVLQKFIGLTGMMILFGMSLSKCRDMKAMYQMVAFVDEKFLDLGVEFNYRFILKFRQTKLLMMMSVCCSYMTTSMWILFHNQIWPSFQTVGAFFVPHIFILSVVVLNISFAMRFGQHFNLLNRVLKNLYHQWDTRTIKTITQKQRSLQCLDSFSMYTIVSKNPSEIIQESMEIHQLICEAASTANKYFTYQLLTIISIAFLIIVFDAYYVLETLLGKSKRESKFKTVEFVTFFSCQMILYLIAIISIVEGSNRVIKKSEKTGGIVHALLNRAKQPEVKEKLQQFSMQLLHLKISFTAAGLFNIDRTLYFTISGALTTYLIILLQFTSSSPPAVQTACSILNSTEIANVTQT